MHAQIAGKLTGRVTKWIVLAAWLALFAGLGSLSPKLVDVQDNEASSWLPGSAESTKVLEELSDTVDPNDIPTLIIYNRPSGLTDDDFAAMDEHASEIAAIDGVTKAGVLSPNAAAQLESQGQPVPRLLSEDGEVAYLYLTFNFGKDGWNDIPDAADDIADIAQIDGVTIHLAGYGGQAADSAEAFEGIDANLIFATLAVVIVILLFTYRSPILWMLPIICAVFAYSVSGGVVYLLAKYADLTVNGQSQAILGILVIGAGTDYALLLVARYREELRRHDDRHEAMAFALHRAAPAILASAATVVVGMLCLLVRRPQLHRRPRSGARRRHRRHLPGDGHAAAGAAGDLRPLDVLAQAADASAPTSPPRRASGPRSATRSPPRPRRSGSITTGILLLACLGLFKLDAVRPHRPRSSTPRSSTRSRASSQLVDHGLPGQLQHRAGGGQRRRHPRRPGRDGQDVDGARRAHASRRTSAAARSYFEAIHRATTSSSDGRVRHRRGDPRRRP